LNHFRDNGFLLKKRAEVLGMLSEGHRTLAVAGTHGKTTTSSILAHLLRSSSLDCNAFLGGISADYGTNFLSSTTSDLLVAEADEYDRSFLRLSPSLAIITSVDADHLDIYGTADEMLLSFKAFAAKVERGGYLIHRAGLPLTDADTPAKRLTYAIDDAADFRAVNVRVEQGKFTFDLQLAARRCLEQPGIGYSRKTQCGECRCSHRHSPHCGCHRGGDTSCVVGFQRCATEV
jgi:UDP-N-acetylmuramate--alanine ligase